MTRRRMAAWALLLVAVVLALALAPPAPLPQADAVVQALPRPAVDGTARPLVAPTAVAQSLRQLPRQDWADLAGSRLWQGAAPPAEATPAPKALPQVPPQAPPLPVPPPAPTPPPFRLLGRYVDGDREGVVLLGADASVLLAHAGEKLGDDYWVESLAGNVMVLSYLPLNLRQTMDIGIAK